MKKKYILATAAVMSSGAVLVLFYHLFGPSIHRPAMAQEASQSSAKPASTNAISVADVAAPEARTSGVRSPQDSKALEEKTAIELHHAVTAGRFSAGEEAYFRIQSAQLCEQSPFAARIRQKRNSDNESTRSLDEFRARYCSGFSGTVATEQDVLHELPNGDSVVDAYSLTASLYEAASDPSPAALASGRVIAKQLDEMMLAEGAGVEALIAAEALQQIGYVSPTVAALAVRNSWPLDRQGLAQAQVLGAQMRICRQHGGCGAGQLVTMQVCAQFGACAPGVTAYAVWRNVYSPAVYQAATRISGGATLARN